MISDPDNLNWISYCMNYIDMILSHDITLYLVFDGGPLPAKEKTEALRAASRSKNQHLATTDGGKDSSRSVMARSIDVTPRMAAQLIRACRQYRPSVKCIVAPYEADAQLSYLCALGVVDGVISEDSDCVPYMCKEVGTNSDELVYVSPPPFPPPDCLQWSDGRYYLSWIIRQASATISRWLMSSCTAMTRWSSGHSRRI